MTEKGDLELLNNIFKTIILEASITIVDNFCHFTIMTFWSRFMHNEFVHLGSVFKKRREEKQVSLKEVESATSIRMSYLQAIEEGNLGKLISPIYAQGFINKYATFLDMDAEKLLREHPYVLKILSEKHSKIDNLFLGCGSLEVRGSPGGDVKWLPNLMWVALSAFGLISLWFLARYLGLF